MGRKKRKVEQTASELVGADAYCTVIDTKDPEDLDDDIFLPKKEAPKEGDNQQQHQSSNYAISSHSGVIVYEDAYVSDGSEDSEEEFLRELEIVLHGSRAGLMRRGIHHQPLQLPNRQWTRNASGSKSGTDTTNLDGEDGAAEDEKKRKEEEELAQLDPAQRAARLLQEKQRREEEARLEAIQKENEDNVSRDPALFSKRTAFDIRLDQIDDKPWQRHTMENPVNISEYFNYGLQEDEWLEYAEQQLMIRQELSDASRQKRPVNPAIVPIQPRKTEPQLVSTTAVMEAPKKEEEEKPKETTENDEKEKIDAVIAPHVKSEADPAASIPDVGGAWGSGAEPGSMLAKLIAEQEEKERKASSGPAETSNNGSRESFSPQPKSDSYPRDNQYRDSQSHFHARPSRPPDFGDRGFPPGRQPDAPRGDYPPSQGHWQGGRGMPPQDFYGRGGRFGRGRGRGGRGPPPQGGGWKRPYEGDSHGWRR